MEFGLALIGDNPLTRYMASTSVAHKRTLAGQSNILDIGERRWAALRMTGFGIAGATGIYGHFVPKPVIQIQRQATLTYDRFPRPSPCISSTRLANSRSSPFGPI